MSGAGIFVFVFVFVFVSPSPSQAVSGGGMVSDWRVVISRLPRSDPEIGESRALIGITGPNLIDPGTGVHQSGGT